MSAIELGPKTTLNIVAAILIASESDCMDDESPVRAFRRAELLLQGRQTTPEGKSAAEDAR